MISTSPDWFPFFPARFTGIGLACLLLTAAGCSRRITEREAEPESPPEANRITWFEGDFESAFAHAESVGKPVFLYWGAEWCPPCHYLKEKIFTRPGFIAKMQSFVPVYLDGDTERAQILGEQLEVQGYPTVILFDPLGQEVMRMPNSVPVDQYGQILDAALAEMKPVSEVLRAVLASGPASASRTDLELLAFYSWAQDSKVGLSPAERLSAFRTLHRESPREQRVARSRFLTLYLEEQISQSLEASGDSTAGSSAPERESLLAEVRTLLAEPDLRTANLVWVTHQAPTVIDFLTSEDTDEREQLIASWGSAAELMEQDDALSVDDRLRGTLLRVSLARLASGDDRKTEPDLPANLQEHVRRQVAWAVATVDDESELQTVVNTMAYLLDRAGLSSEAEELLLARMNETAAPYYFMSWIADLKEEAGDTQEALTWHRRAYESARGRYSRFRWGSTYLRRLMELAPDQAETIETASASILEELLQLEDAFAGGNYSRLLSLERAYQEWNRDDRFAAALKSLQDLVLAACDRYPDDGPVSYRGRCETFLAPVEDSAPATT